MLRQNLAAWSEKAWIGLLGVAPLTTYTRVVRAIASIPVPLGLREPVLGYLGANLFNMDLAEAELDVTEYRSFGDLFVRRLRRGTRPIDLTDQTLVAPVDGSVSAVGVADGGRLLQVKGIEYDLVELLGDRGLAAQLAGGSYCTLYLRPRDYHRVHAPAASRLIAARRLPGRLFPVQPNVVRNLRGLFVRNERLVFELESDHGRWALVCVGAAAVGTISSPHITSGESYRRFESSLALEKGEEVAAFNLGSTVIIVFEPGSVELLPLAVGDEVRVGRAIAQCTTCRASSAQAGGDGATAG